MAKGKKPKTNDASCGDIGRFFLGNALATAASPPSPISVAASAKTKRQPTKRKGGKNYAAGGDIEKFFIKRAPPAAAGASGSNSAAKRKLQFDSRPGSTQNSKSKRQKLKSNIQAPIGQFLKTADAGQKRKANFLEQDFPDPASMPADHRVTEIQFRRDALSVVSALRRSGTRLPLNEEQRRVAECPPNVPLSVRAGAGSGKTHAMVQRAVNLANTYDLAPENILLITFSTKAADELKERIAASFSGEEGFSDGRRPRLPTIKTFHSLAYSWICRCWRACDLGRRPSPLATKSQERSLMRRAIEDNLDRLRLERCGRMLWGAGERPREVNWEAVTEAFRVRHEDDYRAAYFLADEKANENMPDEKKRRAMTAEELRELNEEMKATRQIHVRVEIYLELLRRARGKDAACDLERRWPGDKSQCDMYLDLVRKARLGRHSKSDYLREDACVWELYDRAQREMGRIDFDSMLVLFADRILSNERLAQRFHSMYAHVIVDEFQDNSEAQASMLTKIVDRGSLTVVGDDDQCIYQFRGASPGNFDRLRTYFADERQIAVREETLTENYRSSANILSVGGVFLQGDTSRRPKVLRPTRPPGSPVEIWKCQYANDQVRHIVAAMIERHETAGVKYGDMACLFRCVKMGKLGSLTTHIQVELSNKNIPFAVVGGKTIFERASVMDLLAYLRLLITGSADDDSFERVINRPPRRLPEDKMIPLIKQQVKSNRTKASTTSLQEAAAMMCKTGFGLSSSQHNALKVFVAEIDQLRAEVSKKFLPDLLKYLWRETCLEDFHSNKSQRKTKKGKKSDDDTSENSEDNPKPATRAPKAQKGTAPYYPSEIQSLIELAERHVRDWKEREKEVIAQSRRSKNDKLQSVPSLVELSRNVIMQNKGSIQIDQLPEHILDDIILAPCALGRSVISDFLACAALQRSVENEEPITSQDEVGRVSISTIHRAKGLEWNDVYVPYFNQGFMPMEARNEEDDDAEARGRRHLAECSAKHGDRCDKSCARAFQEMDAERLGASAEERHLNEERRLAHVAATRAKNKLVFAMFEREVRRGAPPPKESAFEEELSQLPNSALQVVRKDPPEFHSFSIEDIL